MKTLIGVIKVKRFFTGKKRVSRYLGKCLILEKLKKWWSCSLDVWGPEKSIPTWPHFLNEWISIDLRPKGRGRPQRILLGVWPDEHIRGVIRAVVFRDPQHIKEEPSMPYTRIPVSLNYTYTEPEVDKRWLGKVHLLTVIEIVWEFVLSNIVLLTTVLDVFRTTAVSFNEDTIGSF